MALKILIFAKNYKMFNPSRFLFVVFLLFCVCVATLSCNSKNLEEKIEEKPPTQQDVENFQKSINYRYSKIGEYNRAIDSLIVFNAKMIDNKMLSIYVGETISNIRNQISATENEISDFKKMYKDIRYRLENQIQKDSTAAKLKTHQQ